MLAEYFDRDRILRVGSVFRDAIDNNPWTMFHGTSGYNAGSIEQCGFTTQHSPVTPAALKRVTSIFAAMQWNGESGGGFPIFAKSLITLSIHLN